MIRRATIKDKEDIIRLGNIVNKNFNNVYDIEEIFKNDYNIIYLYIEEKKIIGMLMAIVLYENCEILNVVVDDDYRKKRVATNLMDTLISELSENVKIITLEVAVDNDKAIGLYRKFGFEVINIRKNYYDNKDAYLMGVNYERC